MYICIFYYLGDWNRLNTQIFKLSPGSTECTSLTADTSSMLRLDLKTKGLIHWNLSSLIFLLSLLHFGILQKAQERKKKPQCKCMCKSKAFISNIALKISKCLLWTNNNIMPPFFSFWQNRLQKYQLQWTADPCLIQMRIWLKRQVYVNYLKLEIGVLIALLRPGNERNLSKW